MTYRKACSLLVAWALLAGTVPLPALAEVPPGEEVYEGSWALYYAALALWLTNPDNVTIWLLLDQLDILGATVMKYYTIADALGLLTDSERTHLRGILAEAENCRVDARNLLIDALSDNTITVIEAVAIGDKVARALDMYMLAYGLLFPKVYNFAAALEETRQAIKRDINTAVEIIVALENAGENTGAFWALVGEVNRIVDEAEREGMENRERAISTEDNLVLLCSKFNLARSLLDNLLASLLDVIGSRYIAVNIGRFVPATRLVVGRPATIIAEGYAWVSLGIRRPMRINNAIVRVVAPHGSQIFLNGRETPAESVENAGGLCLYRVRTSMWTDLPTTVVVRYTGVVARVSQDTEWTQAGPSEGDPVVFEKAVRVDKNENLVSLEGSENWTFVLMCPVPTRYPESLEARVSYGQAAVNTQYQIPEVYFTIAGRSENVFLSAVDGRVVVNLLDIITKENGVFFKLRLTNTGYLPHRNVACRTGISVPEGSTLITRTAPWGYVVVENGRVVIRGDLLENGAAYVYEIDIENVRDPFGVVLAMVINQYRRVENIIFLLPPELRQTYLEVLSYYEEEIRKATENRSVDHLLQIYNQLVSLESTLLELLNRIGMTTEEAPWSPEDRIVADAPITVSKMYTLTNPTGVQKTTSLEIPLPPAIDRTTINVKLIRPGGTRNLNFSISGGLLNVDNIAVGSWETCFVVVTGRCVAASVSENGWRQAENAVFVPSPARFANEYLVTYAQWIYIENLTTITIFRTVPSSTGYRYEAQGASLLVNRDTLVIYLNKTGGSGDVFSVSYNEPPPFVEYIGARVERTENENVFILTVHGMIVNNCDSALENVIVEAFPIQVAAGGPARVINGPVSIYMGATGGPLFLIASRLSRFSRTAYGVSYKIDNNSILIYFYFSLLPRRELIDNLMRDVGIPRWLVRDNLAMIDNLIASIRGMIERWDNVERIVSGILVLENMMAQLERYLAGLIDWLAQAHTYKDYYMRLTDLAGRLRQVLDPAYQENIIMILDRYLENWRALFTAIWENIGRWDTSALAALRRLVEDIYGGLYGVENALWEWCEAAKMNIMMAISDYSAILAAVENEIVAENIRRLLGLLKENFRLACDAQRNGDLAGFIEHINACLRLLSKLEIAVGDGWERAYLDMLARAERLYRTLNTVRSALENENLAPDVVLKIAQTLPVAGGLIDNARREARVSYRQAYLIVKMAYDEMYRTFTETVQSIESLYNEWMRRAESLLTKLDGIMVRIRKAGVITDYENISYVVERIVRVRKNLIKGAPAADLIACIQAWAQAVEEVAAVRKQVMDLAGRCMRLLSGPIVAGRQWYENISKDVEARLRALERGLPHRVDRNDFETAEEIAKPYLIIPYDNGALEKDRSDGRFVRELAGRILERAGRLLNQPADDPDNVLLWFTGYDELTEIMQGSKEGVMRARDNIMRHYITYATHLKNMRDRARAVCLYYSGTKEQRKLEAWYAVGTTYEAEGEFYGALVYYTAVAAVRRDEGILLMIPEPPAPTGTLVIISVVVATAAAAVAGAAFFLKRRAHPKKGDLEDLISL